LQNVSRESIGNQITHEAANGVSCRNFFVGAGHLIGW